MPDLVPLTTSFPNLAYVQAPLVHFQLSHRLLRTKDMLLITVQAAVDCQIPPEYHPFETRIFDTFMSNPFCLPVHTVRHVPRMVRPLLASALCQDFLLSVRHGLWGFARLLMFPKLILHSPPHAGHKKHHLVGALLQLDCSNG